MWFSRPARSCGRWNLQRRSHWSDGKSQKKFVPSSEGHLRRGKILFKYWVSSRDQAKLYNFLTHTWGEAGIINLFMRVDLTHIHTNQQCLSSQFLQGATIKIIIENNVCFNHIPPRNINEIYVRQVLPSIKPFQTYIFQIFYKKCSYRTL